jgi:uncharacterized protein
MGLRSMTIRTEKASRVTSNGEEEGRGAPALAVLTQGGDLLVGVRVIPSAPRTEVRGVYGERLKVAVAAPPEGGKANARLVQALAGWLGLRTEDVRVESGHGGRDKVVAFSGMNEHELRQKLDSLFHGSSMKRTAHGS